MEISPEYPAPAGKSQTNIYQALIARKHSPGRNYQDLGYSQAIGTETSKFGGQVEQKQRWNVQDRAMDDLIGVQKMQIGV